MIGHALNEQLAGNHAAKHQQNHTHSEDMSRPGLVDHQGSDDQ